VYAVASANPTPAQVLRRVHNQLDQGRIRRLVASRPVRSELEVVSFTHADEGCNDAEAEPPTPRPRGPRLLGELGDEESPATVLETLAEELCTNEELRAAAAGLLRE
jgi:hypothetical protein